MVCVTPASQQIVQVFRAKALLLMWISTVKLSEFQLLRQRATFHTLPLFLFTHVSGAQILLIIVNKGNPVVFSTKKNVCILVDSTVQLFDTQSLARGLFHNERLLCSRPSPPLA